MENTTILPTNPTSGAVITSGHHGNNDCGYNRNEGDFGVKDLLITQSIADGTRDTVAASNRDSNNVLREVSAVGRDAITSGNNNHNSISDRVADMRASNERQFGEVREKIATNAAAAAIAAKDIELTVVKESYLTREKSAEQFASLQLQACKDHADIKYTVLSVDADRIRDALRQVQAELLCCKGCK